MKVAFFSVVPSPYQRDMFRALACTPGVELSVFYFEAGVPESPWPKAALEPYEQILPGFGFSLGKARLQVNWPLPNLRQFDVVVCNTMLTSPTGQWLMRFALRRQPWLFWGEKITAPRGWKDHLSAPLARSSGIAAIGTVAERDYRARFPQTRIFNIPYHTDLEVFLATPRHAFDGTPVFLLCGQMIARKGVDLVLAAFARLSAGRLLLVGREAELPQMLGPLAAEVRARITYAGFQPPEELPRFFAQADVFVLPSRYDGWGVVVNQALGAGQPILCSEMVGASHDLVEPEVNGLRFPAGDVDALAAAMQRLVDEPALISRWGDASRQRAADWLPAKGAAKWVQALEAVLDS